MTHIPGYTRTGDAGFGARGAAATVVAPDGTGGVAIVVERSYLERILALRDLRAPSLPEVLDVVAVDDGRVAVILEVVVGPSLATLVQARGRLTNAETVTVWRAVADALAALHARGLVHGDVSPGNIVIAERGPVLLDILGHDGAEVGHRGHVAPEVSDGARPTAASDVWALGRALTWLTDEDPQVVRAVGRALSDDVDRRPTARAFSTWALGLGDPSAVDVPASSSLAGAHVRAGTEETDLLPAGDRPRGVARAVGVAAVACAVAAVAWIVLGEDGRTDVGPAAGDGGAAVEESGAAVEDDAGAAGEDDAGAAGDDVADAAVQLLAARDDAFVARDADALAQVYVPGTEMAEVDADQIRAMVEEGVEVRGFGTTADITGERGADATEAGSPGEVATVEVVLSSTDYERVVNGTVEQVAASEATCVALDLHQIDGEWRIGGAGECENG